MILFLLSTLGTLAFAASAEPLFPAELSCQEAGQLRFVDRGKTSEQASAFCFSEDHSYFLSPTCRSQSCEALKADLSGIKGGALAGKVGSPGFKLCRAAGGSPELLEFKQGEKWWSMDRCLFPGDSSFVDTGILLRRWDQSKKP